MTGQGTPAGVASYSELVDLRGCRAASQSMQLCLEGGIVVGAFVDDPRPIHRRVCLARSALFTNTSTVPSSCAISVLEIGSMAPTRAGDVVAVSWGGDGDVFRLRASGGDDDPVVAELWDPASETWRPTEEPVWRVMLMPSGSDALLGKVGLSLAEAMIP